MRRSPRNLRIACDHRGLTHYGGVFFFQEFLQVLQFRDFLAQQSALSAVSTDWGTTSFVRLAHSRGSNADVFLERLRAQFETSAVPGRFFEMPDHFRIGMGVNTEMFAEGLSRIGRALLGVGTTKP